MATSISTIFITILLLFNLKKYKIHLDKSNKIVFLKVSLASIFMFLIIFYSKSFLYSFAIYKRIFLYLLIGGATYFLIIFFLKVTEFRELIRSVHQYLKILSVK